MSKSNVSLIACSKKKAGFSCRAREMYRGDLFKKSLRYSLLNFQEVFILSAKYGLLTLDIVIEPYNITLGDFSEIQRKEWADKINLQLKDRMIFNPTIFAGLNYCKYLKGEKPLQGLSIGRQLQWFKDRLKEKRKGLLI